MAIKFVGQYIPLGRLKIRNIYKPPANPRAPQWVTPSGYIGAWNEGTDVDYALIASDPDGDIKDYTLVAGDLPSGVSLNTLSGHLLGTIGQVGQDTVFTFTVRVTDKSNLSSDSQFNLLVKDVGTQVSWVTPSGGLGSGDSGADYSKQVKAQSNG